MASEYWLELDPEKQQEIRDKLTEYNEKVKEVNKAGREEYGTEYSSLKMHDIDKFIGRAIEREATPKQIENMLNEFQDFIDADIEFVKRPDEDLTKPYVDKWHYDRSESYTKITNAVRARARARYGVKSSETESKLYDNQSVGWGERKDIKETTSDFGRYMKRLEEAMLFSEKGMAEQYKTNMLKAIETQLSQIQNQELYSNIRKAIISLTPKQLIEAYQNGDLYLNFDFIYGAEDAPIIAERVKMSLDDIIETVESIKDKKYQEQLAKQRERRAGQRATQSKQNQSVKIKTPRQHTPPEPEPQKRKRKKKKKTRRTPPKS